MSARAALDAIEDIYELTPIQQGLLFHSLYEPGWGVYVEQILCAIRGDIDGARLRRAFELVVQRHAVLRTSYHWQGFKKPLQVVMKKVTVPWTTGDWRLYSGVEQRRRMDAYLDEDRRRGFALDQAPVLRGALLQLSDKSYRLLWTFHHLLLDGWSLAIILGDLFRIYEALPAEPGLVHDPPRPYRDYVLWRQRHTDSEAAVYWRRYLAGLVAPSRVTTGSTPSLRGNHEERSHVVPKAVAAALADFARTHRLTLHTIVSGALAAVLARHGGHPDVMFGSTVSGRPADLEHAERMVGLFINALPLRVQVDAGAGLVSWLRRLQDEQVERDRHSQEALVDIQSWSDVPRGVPLFEMLLVFENYPVPARWGSGHARVIGVRALERTSYPLTLSVTPGEQIHLRLAWYAASCQTAHALRLLEHLTEMLTAIALHAPERVGELPLLPSADRIRVMEGWPGGRSEPRRPDGVPEWISQSVHRHPDRTAVACGQVKLSYVELDRRANGLAWRLRGMGIGPETCVGICLGRSPALLIAVLAVLKAGGSYVPIDGSYPRARVLRMLQDAGAGLVLGERGELEWLPREGVRLADVDASEETAEAGPASHALPDNLAYVIYTSGSTGRPKGCGVSRGAFGNLLEWYCDSLASDSPVRALILSSFGFDLTQKNLFAPLIMSGSVHVSSAPYFDSRAICDEIAREQITLINCTPSTLYPLLDAAASDDYRALASLEQVVLGGEPIALPRVARWLASPNCRARVMNSYGPTECADVCASHWLGPHPDDAGRPIPIGRPIWNTHVYVLDGDMKPVPVGTTGELCIGGVGVARGYLGWPGLTAERFVADPFSEVPGSRLYRSGDLVRYRDDGRLDYVGRRDEQVKLRGHRVELGEVEAVLQSHPDVREVAVRVENDEAGHPRLIGYVVGANGRAPGVEELKRHARRWLPEVMVPAAWVALERLPLTIHGKVDRQQLPSAGDAARQDAAMDGEPRTALERELTAIWAQVLGVRHVGTHDNFFDLGGHSLNATLVISRIHERLRAELPLRSLFDAPTVSQFAAVVASALDARPSSGIPPVTALPRRQPLPDGARSHDRSPVSREPYRR